jgi:phosphate transport system substrate-binding protein
MMVPALAFSVTGAGSTFIAPAMSKWVDQYHTDTGNVINYQSIGSGAGIKQIEAGTVDFGATDKPLSDADLSKFSLKQFPVIEGGIVLVYNLPVASGVNLSGDVVEQIFDGKITNWQDPKITALNPGVVFPNLAIVTVHRADGSGTTYNFTKYLGQVSQTWADDVGADTAVDWPGVGLGAKGNEGVATSVKNTVGSIGYVEYTYAKVNKISYSNVDGHVASLDTFKSKEWPIMATTYVLENTTKDNGNLDAFFAWTKTPEATDIAEKLDYIPVK